MTTIIDGTPGGNWIQGGGMQLDQPASTSALTYTLFISCNAGTAYWFNSSICTITLEELA